MTEETETVICRCFSSQNTVHDRITTIIFQDRKNDLKTQEQVTKAQKLGDLLLFQDFFNSPFSDKNS